MSQHARRKALQWLHKHKEKKQLSEWTLDISGIQTEEKNKHIIGGVQVCIYLYINVLNFVQNVVAELNETWDCLIEAEESVLVNILYNPEALFQRGTNAFKQASKNFLSRFVWMLLVCQYPHCSIVVHVYTIVLFIINMFTSS